MFTCSTRMLLLIAGTLLALTTSSSGISVRTYAPNGSYQTCQKLSWTFEQLNRNVTDDQLINSFVKYCVADESGSNEPTCKYIADALLPAIKDIRGDDFCFDLHKSPAVYDEKYSTNCDVCVALINEVKSELISPNVDDIIRQKALHFCNQLPNYEDECKNIVDEDLSSILVWVQTINSNHFCHLIHQCTEEPKASLAQSSGMLNLREPPRTEAKVVEHVIVKPAYTGQVGLGIPLKCEVCDEVMKWSLKLLSTNKTELAIAHALDSVCATFYKHDNLKQAHCSHMVDKYTVQLINLIVDDVKPESICHMLNICPSSSALQITLSNRLESRPKQSTELSTTVRQVKGSACLLCVELFRYVYKRVNANQTEASIEKTMDEACKFLYKVSHKDSQLQKCEAFVAANAAILVQLIKSNAGATLTCLAVGACATPAHKKLNILLIEPPKAKVLAAPKQNQFSRICRNIVDQSLFDKVKSVARNEDIVVHLSRTCEQQTVPQDKVDCSVYVYKRQNELQKALLQARSVDQVCDLAEGSTVKATNTPQSCEMCKLFVGIIYKDLKQNKTEAQIVTFLDKLCTRYAPANKVDDCKARVQAYVVELITILENTSNPAEACAMMGYCGHHATLTSFSFIPEFTQFLLAAPVSKPLANQAVAQKDVHVMNAQNSPACQQCINLVTPVHNLLANKTCQNDLIADVAKLCAKCPAEEKCNDLLQSHIRAYFDAVDKYSEPSLVCHHIGLCTQARATSRINNRLVLKRLQEKASQSNELEGPASVRSEICYECQLITQYAQTVLSNDTVQKSLIAHIKHEFCDPIPSRIERKICDDFFDKDGPQILHHLINTVFDPKKVCEQQIHVCPQSNGLASITGHSQPDHTRRLVGASKCTFGPSYWCTNAQTAAECKATDYCLKKVWSN